MPFVTRCMISILAGIGAGALGFGAAWFFIQNVLHRNPGVGHSPWLIAAIFVPGVAIPWLTFRAVSGPMTQER